MAKDAPRNTKQKPSQMQKQALRGRKEKAGKQKKSQMMKLLE